MKESAELIVPYSQLQTSVTSSLEIALDNAFKQNIIPNCNLLLARRNNLLKDRSYNLGPKDLANLCTGPFDQQEVFDSDVLSQVEDTTIKRISIIKDSDTKSYRQDKTIQEFLISGPLTQKILRKEQVFL